MAHHAYFVAGDIAKGRARVEEYISHKHENEAVRPEVVSLTYGLFSVEDARKLTEIAYRSSISGKKILLASMTRLFHEAQNSLLKILEEPPEGVTIILLVPSEGVIIPTLRSRLLPLPIKGETTDVSEIAAQFLTLSPSDQAKYVAKLVERTKADKDETKQQARQEAVELLSGITTAAYGRLETEKSAQASTQLLSFLEDCTAFMPLLYERSSPIKLIFEHLQLVIPKGLAKAKV